MSNQVNKSITATNHFTQEEQIEIQVQAMRLMLKGLFSISRSNAPVGDLEGEGYILALEQQLDELYNKFIQLTEKGAA